MKFARSLRVKLSILYLLTTVVPVVIIVFLMPSYYKNETTQDSQTLTQATLSAISRNIDTYLDDLNRLTLTPYLDDNIMQALELKSSQASYANATPYQKLVADRTLTSTLPNFLRATRKDILSTIILPFDGSVFVAAKYSPSSPLSDYPFRQQWWYQQAIKADGDVVFVNPHPQDYLLDPISPQVFSVARLIKDPDSQHPLAVVMADEDNVVLGDIASSVHLNVSSITAIFGANDQLLYASQPLSRQAAVAVLHNDSVVYNEGNAYLPVSQMTASAPWKVAILLSQSELDARLHWLYIGGAAFAIGGLCVTLLLFFILSRWIIMPFQRLMGAMQQVQEGNLQTRVTIEGQDEVAVLGRAFNTMTTRLHEVIEREYVATLNQRVAEHRALQSQIQPHFLYNTLNGFIGLNRLGKRQVLERAIMDLSGLLRYVLGSEGQVTLQEEFLFLQRYCDLQMLRFHDKLTCTLHFDEELAQFKMPRVLLQPLVENAVIHGIEPADRPCQLEVQATAVPTSDGQQASLRISITDNGLGFTPATQTSSEGHGLANVRDRLNMVYATATLSIHSEPQQGTQVTIDIPWQQG